MDQTDTTESPLDFARIIEACGDALIRLDPDWRFTYVNERAEALVGRLREDMLGRRIWDTFPTSVGGPFFEAFARSQRGGVTESFTAYSPVAGAWLEVRCYPHGGDLWVHFRDVSAREQAQAERSAAEGRLEEREREYAALVDNAADLITRFDRDCRVRFASRAAERHTGLPPAALIGKSPSHIAFFRADADAWEMLLARVLAEGRPETFAHSYRDPVGGHVRHFESVLTPEWGSDRVHSAVVLTRDVTERRRAAERAERLAAIASALNQARTEEEVGSAICAHIVPAIGANVGMVAALNRAETEFRLLCAVGYPERITAHWKTFSAELPTPGGDAVRWRSLILIEDPAERQARYPSYEHVRIEAGLPPGALAAVPLLVEDRRLGVIGLSFPEERRFSDEERQFLLTVGAQCALALDRCRLSGPAADEVEPVTEGAPSLRMLADAMPQLVWAADPFGAPFYYNRRWQEYTGLSEAESRGDGFVQVLHPEDADRTVARWRRAWEGGEEYRIEYRLRRHDGAHRWFVGRAEPVRAGDTGQILLWVGTCTDIEEQKQAEAALRASEEALRHAGERERERAVRQARIAETLQGALLPVPAEDAFPGLRLRTVYEPAWDEALLGGDFYDAFPLDDRRVALVVGDVTGKGLQAAAATAEVKFALRALLREHVSPGEALGRLNAFLIDAQRLDGRSETSLVALCVAVLDTASGAFTVAAAGAEPPLVARRAGGFGEVPAFGPLAGVEPGARYPEVADALSPGDLVLMFTDGITEARRGRSFFGIDGVAAAVTAAGGGGGGGVATPAHAVVTGARTFGGGKLRDDVCLLAVRFQGTD